MKKRISMVRPAESMAISMVSQAVSMHISMVRPAMNIRTMALPAGQLGIQPMTMPGRMRTITLGALRTITPGPPGTTTPGRMRMLPKPTITPGPTGMTTPNPPPTGNPMLQG